MGHPGNAEILALHPSQQSWPGTAALRQNEDTEGA